MVFKVFYQEDPSEIPVRERTKTLFVEAETEREVRDKLVDRKLNIEHIQKLDQAHLEYEKQSKDFAVETA
ncbi:RNA polymerase epsilon subunit [Lentibacillus sp. N15]|uniref:DNA-dependent RNA polymerase subunit epsilon n=1 Tax=Lentibacillus songyuanensis TaxID=3136161 RepID=UPI0031BAA367